MAGRRSPSLAADKTGGWSRLGESINDSPGPSTTDHLVRGPTRELVRGDTSTLIAFGLAVEIGDWHRLDGRSIGAYLGLVPTSPPPEAPGRKDRSPRPAPTPAGC